STRLWRGSTSRDTATPLTVSAILMAAYPAPAEGRGKHARMSAVKTLLRGGTVLTLDREDRVLVGEDVLVEDERIARVGGRLDERDGPFDRVIDASGRLVMPGLVNAHFHCYDRFLRGMWE